MGEHAIRAAVDERTIRSFTQRMLCDLRALEAMLTEGMLAQDESCVGVEQELFLVDRQGRPQTTGPDVLANVDDARFTSELAVFNLEANLPPQPFDGAFLRTMETQLGDVIEKVNTAGRNLNANALLTGILPSLNPSDLKLENMTPEERYRQLNDALLESRGQDFNIFIRGTDTLELTHANIMLEAANTSLQFHLQVDPRRFRERYNLAQLIVAPLLAASVNSPVLFGRRLWHETRIALFERAVDARSVAELQRGVSARVTFGHDWVQDSVLEIFHENASRYRVVLARDIDEDPEQLVEAGNAPGLAALNLHNGTVWRWNRPCYGISADGTPHLRIETRVLPSGPTVVDEVANAAFYYGMMTGLDQVYGDVAARMPFHEARSNFLQAARAGLDAHFHWLDGREVSARHLILDELLPRARSGLADIGVPQAQIDRYLGIVEARVDSGQTGARWFLEGLRQLDDHHQSNQRHLVCRMLEHQASGLPVHEWPLPVPSTPRRRPETELTIREIMAQDVFTVRLEDVADLAASVMQWKHIRHVPVEDRHGKLVGLVTHRGLLRLLQQPQAQQEPISVEEVMDRNPMTIAPDTPLPQALERLLRSEKGCLLVVNDNHLIGIATEWDFLRHNARLLGINPE